MKRIIILLFILLFPLLGVKAGEGDISIVPIVIDEKCRARDLLEYNIKIKNNLEGRVTLYAVVNDVLEDFGVVKYNDPTELDLTSSLTRWIEFRRGVIELAASEEIEMPLNIKVNQDAPPGKYHARIVLGRGSNREQAERKVEKSNEAELFISLEVEEHIVEKIEITEFRATKGIFTKQPVSFSIKIKNIGNKDMAVFGEVIVYNKGGKELGSVNFNTEKQKIEQGKIKDFPVSIILPEGMGKFKAKLKVEYGEEDKRDIQDNIYFLVLSKIILIIIGFCVFLLSIFLAFLISKKKYKEIQEENLRDDVGGLKKGDSFKVSIEKEKKLILPKTLVLKEKEKNKEESKDDNNSYVINLRSK